MSGIEEHPSPSPFTAEALNIDIVVDEIISHLGHSVHDLKKYRLVSHKWNRSIVRKINQSGQSLHIPLQYGPQVPQLIQQCDAKRHAKEILETVCNTLTGTSSNLHFDSVLVVRDFYLAGVRMEWKHFLEMHGDSIRHLKFKIRSQQFPKPAENHVTDCEEILAMKDLVSTLSAIPNLESLYFSIRFSNYPSGLVKQPKPMTLGDLPKLHKLTKITIREPKGISYNGLFLRKILGIAPNLTSLCIKPSNVLPMYVSALKSIRKVVDESLVSLAIRNAHLPDFNVYESMIHFPFLHLTTLELNNIYGVGRNDWVEKILLHQRSSLINLILGDRKNTRPLLKTEDLLPNFVTLCFVQFPPVMEQLKILEVNISKFRPFRDGAYEIQFPVLESFALSGATEDMNGNEWRTEHICNLLRWESGRCQTLRKFSLIGPIHELSQMDIITSVHMTFPKAECHFHSESDNQFSRDVKSDLSICHVHMRDENNQNI